MHLHSRIEINGINPYVLVPQSFANSLKPNWRKALPVMIKVNQKPESYWHINMVPKGDGDFYLYLHNDVRLASDTKVGDTVDVEILFDDAYQNGPQHSMPKELELFLEKNKQAREAWAALSPSRQKEVLRYLAGLKSEEARQRNIEKIKCVLNGETMRFMARDWNIMH